MRTQKQIETSRLNGAKSRGPVSAEGKAISSRNAITHGALAYILVEGEDEDQLIEIYNRLVREHEAQTDSDFDMIEAMTTALWQQRRMREFVSACLTDEIHAQVNAAPHLAGKTPKERGGRGWKSAVDNSKAVEHAMRYEARYERQYFRYVKHFRDLKKERQNDESNFVQNEPEVDLVALYSTLADPPPPAPKAPVDPQPEPPAPPAVWDEPGETADSAGPVPTVYKPKHTDLADLAWSFLMPTRLINSARQAYRLSLQKAKTSSVRPAGRPMNFKHLKTLVLALAAACSLVAQKTPKITTPKESLGFNLGDDYQMATYSQLEVYWKKLATESDRMKLVEIGKTGFGRPHYMAIISSPENLKNMAKYKTISQRLAHAEGVTEEEARRLSRDGKAIVWIDGGLHANETVGSQQLMETVYQLVSRTDPETMRLLSDDIVLCVQANPDGQEIVADWYMREKDPLKRTLNGIPTLYNKYIGHDDNRDFYMSSMPETTNMNRQLFYEWFPEIVYNHHQTGPAGAVIFMPPFRDPFNYNLDPLVPLGIEQVGTAMHSRLVAEGKGGSAMRSGSSYSTWWNGGLRTITYFHNMIGLLTEIIGSPTPMDIALVPDKQLPQGDWPLPIAPQKWHYRQSIDYEITNNYAVLDVAARNRETFLFNAWRMGMNSIERGSRDNWTITPKRIEALKAAAPGGGRGGADAGPTGDAAPPGAGGGRGGGVPAQLYETVLHDPKHRDPRGYIIPADQADFATATKFIDTLLKNGITVDKATSAFSVNGKSYPTGSYVVLTAQAFRPHILDMFEPQDHPNDLRYPGGPPVPPYDIAGWTLAMQMGVQFDRILDKFTGPFAKVEGLLPPPPAAVTGPANSAGWLISHKENDSFTVVNRLLKAKCDVYWLKKDVENMGTGAVWVPSSPAARQVIEASAKQLGVGALAMAQAPAGEAMKLKPIRIGLYDQYGGSMPSGWTRFVLEQFEFPFETVYPQTLDAGDLKSKFDVLVFVDGAARLSTTGGRGGGRGGFAAAIPDDLPDQYKTKTGRITADKTMPQINRFVEAGGDVVTIGSSTSMAELLGIPVKSYMTEMGPDGKERPLPQDKFYVPGSLLKISVDNTNPLAYGMPDKVDVFFDSSPVFKLLPDAGQKHTSAVGWYGADVLDSGWAWGQQYLNGGTAIAEASVGEGKVILLGPEVAFRAQPHGTFKFLFNGLYMGSAQTVSKLP